MASRNPIQSRESRGMPLMAIQQRVNELFDNFLDDWGTLPFSSILSRFPSLNVSDKEREVVIKAELPGLNEQDVKIEISNNQLTIRGEKKSETEDEDKEGTYYLQEISYGNFSRTITMPFDIDENKAKATFSKGVLTIKIQKPEENRNQPKMIPISH